MKKILQWVIGVPVVLLVILASIGLLAKCSDPKGYEQKQQEMAVQDDLEKKEIVEDPKEAARRNADAALLDHVDSILRKQGLSVCEVYRWAGESEDRIRQRMEARYGIPTAMKMYKERNAAYDKDWQQYRKKHKIPDSLRVYINVLGVKNCQ